MMNVIKRMLLGVSMATLLSGVNAVQAKPQLDFTPENSAILLVDHQKMTMDWIHSQDASMVKKNLRMLGRLGNELNIPLVITTTMEEQVGPTFEGIIEVAPKQHAARIKRGGTINAFLDPSFRQAIKQTGRKNLIIAGLTTDICLLQTVKGALNEGYNVMAVADASGSMTPMADDTTFVELTRLGVSVVSANATLAELYPDFGSAQGEKAMKINLDEVVSKMGK